MTGVGAAQRTKDTSVPSAPAEQPGVGAGRGAMRVLTALGEAGDAGLLTNLARGASRRTEQAERP